MKDDKGYPLHLGADKNIFSKARELRTNMTRAECVLWEAIRNGKLNGFKFRRQHPINNYIADFYCHKVRLIVEVDGGIHKIGENKEYDKDRTFELEKFERSIIRFTNDEVLNNIDNVLYQIKTKLNQLIVE
jgi:very-short-patch-repair endonuclease